MVEIFLRGVGSKSPDIEFPEAFRGFVDPDQVSSGKRGRLLMVFSIIRNMNLSRASVFP